MFVVLSAGAPAISENISLVIGDTANLSCFAPYYTTSLDFYYQLQDGASPILIYANHRCLNNIYHVITSTGERLPNWEQGRI